MSGRQHCCTRRRLNAERLLCEPVVTLPHTFASLRLGLHRLHGLRPLASLLLWRRCGVSGLLCALHALRHADPANTDWVQEDRRQRNAGFWRLLEPKQRIKESQWLRSLLHRGIKILKTLT